MSNDGIKFPLWVIAVAVAFDALMRCAFEYMKFIMAVMGGR